MMKRRQAWIWWTLAVAIAAGLLWMTLRSNQAVAADLSRLAEMVTSLTRAAARLARAARRGISRYLLTEPVGNIAVFVPLGAVFALGLGRQSPGRRLLLATLMGAAFSLGIEYVQMRMPNRDGSPRDILLNTLGTAVGALCTIVLVGVVERIRRPR